ncbi:MAG: hypothetical protein WC806_05645 [Candidatus Gracilibacteria bacterium]|jgi:hypothetical protein
MGNLNCVRPEELSFEEHKMLDLRWILIYEGIEERESAIFVSRILYDETIIYAVKRDDYNTCADRLKEILSPIFSDVPDYILISIWNELIQIII